MRWMAAAPERAARRVTLAGATLANIKATAAARPSPDRRLAQLSHRDCGGHRKLRTTSIEVHSLAVYRRAGLSALAGGGAFGCGVGFGAVAGPSFES
jgi:hypothetical protein